MFGAQPRGTLRWSGALAIGMSLAVIAGCGGDSGAGAGGGSGESASGKATKGEIVVDGSSTVFRISKAAQEAFADVDDSITVVVDNRGTGAGFEHYNQGEVDIIDASRPAKPQEEKTAAERSLPWTRFLVGYDGISVVTNPKNTWAQSLTVEQLKTIWAPGSAIKNWKEINPSWPDRKIVLFSPDNDSGTYDFFTEAITGKTKAQRVDGVQQSSDDNVLVNGVAGDEGSLGYFGYAYYAANKTKLRALEIQKGEGKPVAPTPETILSKEYDPLSRPLFIYVKNASVKRPEVAKFLRFYLDNIEKLSQEGGYVAPTSEDRKTNDDALKALLGG